MCMRTQVKFMKSKPGAAMVEMGDCYAVERAISHLNHTMLFEQKLNIWYVSTDPVHPCTPCVLYRVRYMRSPVLQRIEAAGHHPWAVVSAGGRQHQL